MTDLQRHELDEIVRDAAAAHGHAGFSVAVLQGDQLLQVAAGLANPELGIEMTDDTLVQIGSTAKLFNAAVVMRLVEQGALDLDQPVAELIDGFQLSDDRATKTITLRHLLTMTSGMDGGTFDDHGGDDGNLARYVGSLTDLPHLFPPGAGFAYSNAGVIVAGHAAEVATGQRWDELLRELILFPAGMERIETVAEGLVFHRVAVGVDLDGDVVRPWTMTRSMAPAGSTAGATAGDLARFAGLFLSEGRSGDGTQVLSPEMVMEMTRPAVGVATGFPFEQWCLGAGLTQTATHAVYGHPGFNISGCSFLWWVPGLDVAVACATNAPSAYDALVLIARSVLRHYRCEPPGDPVPQTDQAVEGMEPFLGTYASEFLRYEVGQDGGELMLRAIGLDMLAGHEVRTRLVPAGRHGFLPGESLLPSFDTPTAVAFADYGGVKILLNGNGAAPKVTTPLPA